jgi:hypothetical protein
MNVQNANGPVTAERRQTLPATPSADTEKFLR